MATVNYAAREINVKIVYYGPALSGKTTNLQIIHKKSPDSAKSDMVSLATEADRTLFFDFLPIDLGKIKGFTTKIQLYTVPGQVYYNATRKLVLRGVDGIVFVADSAPEKMAENIESLENMEANLAEYGYDLNTIPVILQYNKRDLPNALPVEQINQQLNRYNTQFANATARSGEGVFETLKLIGKRVIDILNHKYSSPQQGMGMPSQPAQPQAVATPPQPTQQMTPPAPAQPVVQPTQAAPQNQEALALQQQHLELQRQIAQQQAMLEEQKKQLAMQQQMFAQQQQQFQAPPAQQQFQAPPAQQQFQAPPAQQQFQAPPAQQQFQAPPAQQQFQAPPAQQQFQAPPAQQQFQASPVQQQSTDPFAQSGSSPFDDGGNDAIGDPFLDTKSTQKIPAIEPATQPNEPNGQDQDFSSSFEIDTLDDFSAPADKTATAESTSNIEDAFELDSFVDSAPQNSVESIESPSLELDSFSDDVGSGSQSDEVSLEDAFLSNTVSEAPAQPVEQSPVNSAPADNDEEVDDDAIDLSSLSVGEENAEPDVVAPTGDDSQLFFSSVSSDPKKSKKKPVNPKFKKKFLDNFRKRS